MGKHFLVWSVVAARVLCLLFVLSLLPQAAMAQEPTAPAASEFETRVRTAIETPGDWEFIDTPLQDVADHLREKLQIDVLLDKKALEDMGIDVVTPVNLSVHGITARSALRLILEPLEMAYILRDEAIWITSQEAAEARLVTRVYPVGELVLVSDEDADYDSLIVAITGSIAPDSWDEVGGPGTIEAAYGSVVVAQTGDVHAQIEGFLNAARKLADAHTVADQSTTVLLPQETEGDAQIRAALQASVDGEFVDVSLGDALHYLAEAAHIPIVLDGRALEDLGVDQSTPITARFTGVPLKSALGRILSDLDLTYLVRDEVLRVTTKEVAEQRLVLALYPVDDLVMTDPHDPASADFDTLISLIMSTVHPDTWNEAGGPSSLECLPRPRCCLVIPQTESIHEEIGELLAKLRWVKRLDSEREATSVQSQLHIRTYKLQTLNQLPLATEEVIRLINRELGAEIWTSEQDVYLETLGTSLVVKHNAKVHRRLNTLLQKLGVYQWPGAGGFGGGTEQPAAQPGSEAAGGGGGGGLGGGGGYF